jgi:hypothetical protein
MIYSYCRESENLKILKIVFVFFFSHSFSQVSLCVPVLSLRALENRAQCAVGNFKAFLSLFFEKRRVAVHRRGVPNGCTEERKEFNFFSKMILFICR